MRSTSGKCCTKSKVEKEKRRMILKIDEQLSIDNLKGYPTEVVQQLEKLLNTGVEARVDPKRENFYDLETAERGFFIHAHPLRRRVTLLATWLTELPVAVLEQSL
jgi:hypothetical protein